MRFLFVIIFLLSNVLGNDPWSDFSSVNYKTDQTGKVYMFVNVLGHVNQSGTYKIYEDMDIMTILSAAGGPKSGANFKNLKIYRQGQQVQTFDLDSILKKGKFYTIDIKPNDTIFVEQGIYSKIISNQSLITMFLTIMNVYIALTNSLN